MYARTHAPYAYLVNLSGQALPLLIWGSSRHALSSSPSPSRTRQSGRPIIEAAQAGVQVGDEDGGKSSLPMFSVRCNLAGREGPGVDLASLGSRDGGGGGDRGGGRYREDARLTGLPEVMSMPCRPRCLAMKIVVCVCVCARQPYTRVEVSLQTAGSETRHGPNTAVPSPLGPISAGRPRSCRNSVRGGPVIRQWGGAHWPMIVNRRHFHTAVPMLGAAMARCVGGKRQDRLDVEALSKDSETLPLITFVPQSPV